MSLCFRCEYRAQFHETGHAPRYECGQSAKSVCGCYMYRPVMPCGLAKAKGDRRPMFGGAMFAARMAFVRTASEGDLELGAHRATGGHLLLWGIRK